MILNIISYFSVTLYLNISSKFSDNFKLNICSYLSVMLWLLSCYSGIMVQVK